MFIFVFVFLQCKAGDNFERLISRMKTPSPTTVRGDSIKSIANTDILESLSSNAEIAQRRYDAKFSVKFLLFHSD